MILRNILNISKVLILCIAVSVLATCVNCLGPIVYAVNCGGEAHTDTNGIHYERDPLHGKIGIASDYGRRLSIGRVPVADSILYQTERYHTSTFGYDIPTDGDGDYVLVLKFCEVYFNAPDQKVFDVILNGDITIISDLDIYDRVGKGVAYDEYLPIKISKGRIHCKGEEANALPGRLRIDFIKGYKDNPKLNAMFLMKGKLDQVPKLPSLHPEPEVSEEPKEEPEPVSKNRRPTPPKQPDPYVMDDSSVMLPVFIAIGAFIPLLFCLCKL